MQRRRGTAVAGLLVVVAAVLLATGLPSAAQDSRDNAHRLGAQELGDPDYGVCRGPDPKCYHDWGNFDAATGLPRPALHPHGRSPPRQPRPAPWPPASTRR